MSATTATTPKASVDGFSSGLFGSGLLGDLAERTATADTQARPLGQRREHLRLSRSARLLKRALDLLGATLILILGAPLLVLAAAAIRFEGPGAVFFLQTRVGRDGRPFRIVKLRTMVVGADRMKDDLRGLNEAVGLFKIAADPRITRVGAFLRKTCIDELPQLFNVLRGEMSLVGPRPLIPEEDRQISGWHRARLHTAPGMTGHWQVLGAARIPLAEMVAIDCRYLASWSIWGDIKTLARTIPCVLARRGM
jgi:lipopolysaccharide/colanic/teichoic acid biosynthesis glycosyltransferase